jgi:hypothetical protein
MRISLPQAGPRSPGHGLVAAFGYRDHDVAADPVNRYLEHNEAIALPALQTPPAAQKEI